MNDEQRQFLMLVKQPPARLTVEQTSYALGFQPYDIPVLVKADHLKPLGKPPPNGIKFFAAAEILALAKNRVWLAKATNLIHDHWRRKNKGRRDDGSDDSEALAS